MGVGLMCRPVEELSAAIEALAEEAIEGLSLRDDLRALEALRTRLDAQIARRLVEFGRSREWAADGARSAGSWLIGQTRCASGSAHHRTHVARQVDAMPLARAAWRDGAITSDHAAAMAQVRSAAHADEEFAKFEAALCDVARSGTPEDVARVGRRWRDALDDAKDRDGSNDPTIGERQHERRSWYFSRSIHGMGFAKGTFDPEGAEIVETAIARMYARLHQAHDPRTPAQQRNDAFVEICRRFCDGQARGTNRPHIILLEDAPTAAGEAVGLCQTIGGYQLSPETMRRLSCDAIVQRLLVDDTGVPLAMGRAERTFTADQWRALVARDGGCRFPGCDMSADYCEAHHQQPWGHGGRTNLAEGLLVCRGRGHHRYLHEGHGKVVGNANGQLDWYAADGTWIGTTYPRKQPRRILTTEGELAALIRTRAYALTGKSPPRHAA